MLRTYAYGRIASDIKLEQKDEIMYTNFLLASHERNDTTFIRCVAFGPIAKLLSQYCGKGDRITLTGDLIPDKYVSIAKHKNIDTFKIKVDTFDFVEIYSESLKNRMKNTQ